MCDHIRTEMIGLHLKKCLLCNHEMLVCLDRHRSTECSEYVEFRISMSPSGVSYPRCDKHFELAYQRYLETEAKYGMSSSVAPAWFDESDAGERWNDDY